MNRATRLLAAALMFAAALGLTAPPGARAQQPGRFPEPVQQPPLAVIPGGGTDLFRALLDREGVQPVSARDFQMNNVRPGDDLIVVVMGSPNWMGGRQDPLGWARQALQLNGAALIATDSPTPLHHFNFPFQNDLVANVSATTVRADGNDCHRKDPDCPYVVPVSPDEHLGPNQKPGPVWGVFRGLTKLATNQPAYLAMNGAFRGEFQYPLARLPKSSFQAWTGMGINPQPLFAVGGDGPEQRWNGRPGYAFLAVADPSVYINQMLMERTPGAETQNLEFTLNTIEYLQGPQKHRKRCLFFENGRVIDSFDGLRSAMAKPKPKIPPEAMPNIPGLINKNQDKLIDMGNGLADQVQRKDALHNMLLGDPGSSRERRRFAAALEVFAVVAAIAIALVLLRRTLRARQPLDVPPPPTTGAGTASTGPPGVFDRRQKELVRRNNLYEPVRNLMREFFDSVGAPPNPGPRIPPLEISDVVRKPQSLRQAIRDMWRIAYGPPQPISAQRWFELEPYFDRLRKAHADGKWRFVTDEA